ncbi:MAG: phosphatidate cytidylyltransferase [Dehalococcoidia bacterium]
MLRQRVLSAAVLIPVLLLAIWFGAPWFTLVLAVAALLGIVEFYAMAGHTKLQPLTVFGTLWVLFFILNAHYAHSYSSETVRALVTLALVISAVSLSLLCSILLRTARESAFASWTWSLVGVLYLGWLLSYWILLRNSSDWVGRDWVLLALFSTFAVDTMAYFVGRVWGRRKLAPAISPGKTWEGAVGGLVGAIGAVVILAQILDIEVGYAKLLFLGVLIGLFAQLGDLAESKLKRVAGVKEASNLIPGHGGILDRLDSVVFTGVLVYYCLKWFIV